MSIRRRASRTGAATMKTTGCTVDQLPLSQVSWQADYRDSAGVRRHRQFLTQRKAKEFLAQTTVEVAGGRHVAESQSRTVAEAAAVWLERCRNGDPTGEPGPLRRQPWPSTTCTSVI